MTKSKAISLKKKVMPSSSVLARAFARRKVVPSQNVIQRVFSESGLERASREGVSAWFKKTVMEQFKKWHVHKDGSTPQMRIIGEEDFAGSQSELEQALAPVKVSGGGAGGYELGKKGKPETAGGTKISYKAGGTEKGGTEIKYTTTAAGASYKADTAAGGASYQAHSAVQYSQEPGVNVQCSCGMTAHASQDKGGNIGFTPLGGGGSKSDSGMYSAYKGGQQQSGGDMYRAGGANYSST